MDITANRERFTEILDRTGSVDAAKLVEALDKLGFFTAPASSRHHLAEAGGLCQHSLNVYDQAMAIRAVQVGFNPALADRLPESSVAVVALLHDVCKAEVYKSERRSRKTDRIGANGKPVWEDYTGYACDYSHLPLGHGEKSVIRLLKYGLDLTTDEVLAIRWHMGGWCLAPDLESKGCFNAAVEKCPLLSVIIAADELATRLTENSAFASAPPAEVGS